MYYEGSEAQSFDRDDGDDWASNLTRHDDRPNFGGSKSDDCNQISVDDHGRDLCDDDSIYCDRIKDDNTKLH